MHQLRGYIVKILTCIVCDYQPDIAYNGCEINQPYKATTFLSRGHYGSTFFDPLNGTIIEVNVCDECLRKALEKKQILHYTRNGENGKLYKDEYE
jgi:hypothetical protein